MKALLLIRFVLVKLTLKVAKNPHMRVRFTLFTRLADGFGKGTTYTKSDSPQNLVSPYDLGYWYYSLYKKNNAEINKIFSLYYHWKISQ
jgi:hypothetical protein